LADEKPKLPDLPDGWTRIEPGGDTRCAHDTPFAFWVRPGTSNNLLVYYRGGGSCWDAKSCRFGSEFYYDTVSTSSIPDFPLLGIFDLENPENPFKDYYMVMIPICTGDIHWGNKTAEYATADGLEFTIEHRGFINASAARDWVFANFTAPESIFVAGCSAGGVGSIFHVPHFIHQYPGSRVTQLSDSSAVVLPERPNFEAFFAAHKNFPNWIPELQQFKPGTFEISDFYIAVAAHYPEYVFSQFNATEDRQQLKLYIDLGGTMVDFYGEVEKSLTNIHQAAPNFRSFTMKGFGHCMLGKPGFYNLDAGGVRIRDWVANLASTGTVSSVQGDRVQVEIDN